MQQFLRKKIINLLFRKLKIRFGVKMLVKTDGNFALVHRF